MTETVERPCIRGCTFPPANDEEGKPLPGIPKPARHGNLCSSDYYRIRAALELIPDLMANMRAQFFNMGAQQYTARVTGGGTNSAAPMNLGPLDAGDSLYARLAAWSETFAEEFGTPPLVIPAWSNSKEIQGSLTVTGTTAHRLASQLVAWFTNRLEQISASTSAGVFHDDLAIGNPPDSPSVFSLSAAYGVKARPTPEAAKRQCPLCGEMEIFLHLPDAFDMEYSVECGRCQWVLDPEYHRKKTGRVGLAILEAKRPDVCAVCLDPIEVGNLINKIDGLTTHNGCEGVIGDWTPRKEPDDSAMGAATAADPRDHHRQVGAEGVGNERAGDLRRGAEAEADPVEVSAFEAKFGGPCAAGCDGIEEGDTIRYVNDRPAHVHCEPDDEPAPERELEVCQECWLIKPCGCEEF
jgi:hypothetical protein